MPSWSAGAKMLFWMCRPRNSHADYPRYVTALIFGRFRFAMFWARVISMSLS